MDVGLSPREKDGLLSDARESIASRLESRAGRFVDHAPSEALNRPCGAFVTLHRGTALRGCIGRMSAPPPLWETVRAMARSAAFEDPRFPPLARDELYSCRIEISVLSPMAPCVDPRSVEIGRHGLYLSSRGCSGVLLPQVPVEQGWGLEEFLDYICRKAGLPPRSYEEEGAALYTFTAEVFSEPAR